MWTLFNETQEPTPPKRVFVDVTGDLFHFGHVEFFKRAKSLGGPDAKLIVGVHDDEACEKYKRKPIMTHDERCRSVKTCSLVDEVIENSPIGITRDFIQKHSIDLVVHGDDICDSLLGQYAVPMELGIMEFVGYTPGISTSEIISRINTM